MQLNAGSFFESGWQHRRQEIVAWIDSVSPDIVCLQEIWRRSEHESTAAWIADAVVGQWYEAFGGHPLPERHSTGSRPAAPIEFGSAVLSRWPIEHHSSHPLPSGRSGESASAFPYEVVHVSTAGLDVFSTHLSAAPTDGDRRLVQVVALDNVVREVRGSRDRFDSHGERRVGMPPILCGDFNSEPESDEIRFLRGLTVLDERTTFWQDAWLVAGPAGDPGHTQDWRTHDLAADLNIHRKRIDYVFVGDAFRREGNAGRVRSARLVCDEALTGVQASDHMGLLVDIEWPERPMAES